MKVRMPQKNINTKEYFEEYYKNPNWNEGNDGMLVRLSQAMELIKKEYKKHLDVGCADGFFTKYYLEKFPETEGWGVDIAESACELARKNCPKGNFLAASCYNLPFENESFDLVHSAEMLEHLEAPEEAIKEMYRVLKKGGHLIITTPNERADTYIEHIWRWDTEGVRLMIETSMDKDKVIQNGFKIIEEYPNFHNGHIMYLVAEKQ